MNERRTKYTEDILNRAEYPLPNGHTLYRRLDSSTGGNVYVSDEVGGGVEVWNTAHVSRDTLEAAIVEEARWNRAYVEQQKDLQRQQDEEQK